jgi:6-phosphogluconolactonase
MQRVRVLPDTDQVAEAAVDLFIHAAVTAIERQGFFSVGLSGGSTPSRMYHLLASPVYQKQLDWQKVHFFWGDERCVPPNDSRSNYHLANELLLDHLLISPGNIHQIRGELLCGEGALQYENELRAFFGAKSLNTLKNTFDLLLLGIGDDGHTASLFPGSPALKIRDRWVVGVEHRNPPDPPVDRISLTLAAINASLLVVFLVTGANKAHILARVLEPTLDQSPLPASLVHPRDGELIWLLDAAAASELSKTQPR